MKNTKIRILFIVILMISNSITASDIKWIITGKVIDNETKLSIPYVTISLHDKENQNIITGTISNDNGEFSLDKISEGTYYLKLSFMGYKDYVVRSLAFNQNQKALNLGVIALLHDMEALSEVVVKSQTSLIRNNVDKQIINVEKNLSAIGGTAADALKLSPSIQTDTDGGVKLRGSSNFKVLINGKPTTLSSDEVLKQTPANNISKIEVITNPSVKYSAEGGAGIVNIILKKGIESGFNGLVNMSVGTKDKYSGDVTFNLNKEKISFSSGFDWRDYTKTAFNNYYRNLYTTDNVHNATMLQDRKIITGNLGFRFGLDYNPNEKNNITYSFHTGYSKVEGDIKVKTSGKTVPVSTEEYSYNTFYLEQKPKFFTNNLGYTKTLNEKGSKLSFNAYYSYIDYYLFNTQRLSKADQNHTIIDTTPYLHDVLNENNSNDLRIDGDYTHIISDNITIETGASFHMYNRFLDITYSTFDYEENNWVNSPDYTNKYNFDEDIYASYLNINSSIWGIKTSIGLRLEYMDRILKQQASQNSYKYDKLNFFPGFSFSKSFDENKSLSLVMSNRINRPDEYMMNPFPEFEDDYFYAEGNPYLIPEIVRNLELGYKYSNNKTMLSSNLYYRKTVDKLEQKLTIGDKDKIHTIFHNDASDKAIGLELMGNFNLTDWWSVNANSNLYHYEISANIEGTNQTHKDFSWSSQLVNSINLNKTTSLEVIGYYNSKTTRSQGELSSYYFVDAALKKQFLDGKLSVSLQIKDILQSLNYELATKTGNMDLLGDFNNESPIFLFNMSYKISNYKKKTKDVQTDFDM